MGYQPYGNLPGLIKASSQMSFSQLRGGIIHAKEVILAGGTKGVIRSQNYDPTNELGWAIFGDGSAFFYGEVFFGQNAIFQGDLVSGNWDGSDPVDLSSGPDGTATVGFALDSSAGAAQFMGDLFLGGDLTMIAGGTFSTATSGARVNILKSNANRIEFHPDAGEITPALITANSLAASLEIIGPDDGALIKIREDDIELYANGSNAEIALRGTGGLPANSVTVFFDTTESMVFDSTGATLSTSLFLPDGSVSTPGLAFANDLSTGIRRIASGEFGFVHAGSEYLRIDNGVFQVNELGQIKWYGTTSFSESGRRYILEVDEGDFDSLKLIVSDSGSAFSAKLRVVDATIAIGSSLGAGPVGGLRFPNNLAGQGIELVNISGTDYFRPLQSGGVNLGSSSNPWGQTFLGSGSQIAGNTIWHAGNDGSGSGLDADTVDGQHASAFSTDKTLAQHIALGLAQGGTTIASSANAHYDETSTLRLVRRATSTMFAKRDITPLRGGTFDIVPEDRQGTLVWSQGDILAITPALFRSDLPDDDQGRVHLGLIAEDVARHVPEAASYRDGKPDGVEWNTVTALLIDEVKSLNVRVAALEAKLGL